MKFDKTVLFLMIFYISIFSLISAFSYGNVTINHSTGDSMIPVIINSTSVCLKQTNYDVGDIVIYKSNLSKFPNNRIEHRIILKIEFANNSSIIYKVAGDNPEWRLVEDIPKFDIICKTVFWLNNLK